MVGCKSAVVGLVAAVCCVSASADAYELTVTRTAGNLYRVDGKNILIRTQYCYAYAYSEDSILKWEGYGGKLIFIQSKDSCDVKAVYGPSKQQPGRYTITVSRQDDDWYEIFNTNTVIKTTSCLSLALGEEAFLSLSSPGYGQLIFKDGNSCVVEGLYSKMRL